MADNLNGKKHHIKKQGITLVSVVPVRKKPAEQAEMVTQLLFGETYEVEENTEKWLKIVTRFDQCTGWIDSKLFHQHASETTGKAESIQPVLYSKLAEITMPDGSVMLIPAGSSLPGYDPESQTLSAGHNRFKIHALSGKVTRPPTANVSGTALQFLNTPYLWGGRSLFGYDCSGFVQTVYKIHGIQLPRDTGRQAGSGILLQPGDELQPGDLAFFGGVDGTVSHVGMILPGGEIIHCSGWVRIDKLDETGIFNRETGKYTHRLLVLRRII
jgi:gamma-D-glutamyl-L-lysine dipeptidyl-peptidase